MDAKSAATYPVLRFLAPGSRAGDVLAWIQGCRIVVILREDPRGYRVIGSMDIFSLYKFADGDNYPTD
jgi:hypothetical protein